MKRVITPLIALVSLALAFTLGSAATALANGASKASPGAKTERVTFMTRNLYLGTDLGQAFRAPSFAAFTSVVGTMLAEVKMNNFPQRARGLADEIHQRKPDVVGMQEVALWRTGPLNINAILEQKPTASTVYVDFLAQLMKQLNRKKTTYRVVSVADEFDFEAPADTTGDGTLDLDARLTMRDVVLVRTNAGVKVQKSSIVNQHFTKANSFTTKVLNLVDVTSTRGWQRMNIKVRNSPWFRYGNVHTESFDDRSVRPSLRALQAQEFATGVQQNQGSKPLVASGDFNSDFPGLYPGDEQAYVVMTANGFSDIGTKDPWSCCIKGDNLHTGGSIKDFDHRVDQFWTDTPTKVKTLKTWVTGRHKSYGYWHSDHAGVVIRAQISKRPQCDCATRPRKPTNGLG